MGDMDFSSTLWTQTLKLFSKKIASPLVSLTSSSLLNRALWFSNGWLFSYSKMAKRFISCASLVCGCYDTVKNEIFLGNYTMFDSLTSIPFKREGSKAARIISFPGPVNNVEKGKLSAFEHCDVRRSLLRVSRKGNFSPASGERWSLYIIWALSSWIWFLL